MSGPGKPDALDFLRRSEAFAGLGATSVEVLAESATIETLESGDALIAEGDAASDAFVVVTGRLEVLATEAVGKQVVVAELGPGDVVGEMALLTGAPRSATVRAVRDSLLIRVTRAQFLQVARNDPNFVVDLARTLVARLDRSIHQTKPSRPSSVVGVIPAGTGGDHDEFVHAFASVLGRTHSVGVVGSRDLPGSAGSESRGELVMYLERMESSHDLTLLVADGFEDAWTQLCARHADAVLLVGTSSGLAAWSAAERALESIQLERMDVQTHLVILHGASSSPSGTKWLLDTRSVDRHHHVRLDGEDDLARLARIVTGTSVGLVLSGGGARGFAHFGVIKALGEAGVGIDHIGGTSIGASIAGVYAAGWDWDTMLAKERYTTTGQGHLVDVTLPMVALGRGGRLTNGIREGFGDRDLTDLWLDCFCVSTDLTAGQPRVHTDGPVWRAVRASTAIPGVFPPIKDYDDHLLVDGGVVNNLPVDTMRTTFAPATVIAVDVRGTVILRASDLPDDGVVSGWQSAANRISLRRPTPEVPGIVEVLSAASSVDASDHADHADWVLTPPVQDFGVLDFAANERIIDIGYDYAREAIMSWDVALAQ